jgi:hypothetical protein
MNRKLKKKYEGKTMSNGRVRPFFTSSVTPNQIEFYCKMGFEFIFEVVKDKKKDD